MLKVSNLSRSFEKIKAVNDLSFEIDGGEVFALLGPNGSGKTTTIKMILGMLKPDNGKIQFLNQTIEPSMTEYKRNIGYVPEQAVVYENLSGLEYVTFVGNLYNLPDDELKGKAAKLFNLLEMSSNAKNQLIREYSKGMKQKLLLITSMIHNPKLFIFDEPFSGLDANSVSVYKEIIKEQVASGKSVLFCSHILDVVEKIATKILIIKKGKELVAGTPDEIISQTKFDSLDRAFNELTGQDDIDSKAKEIVDIITDKKND